MDIFGVSYLQMLPRQKKKSVTQRQPAAPQVPDTPFHDLKNFERFKFFSERQIFKPYVLSLDVATHFGIRDEVADMMELPKWKYLLMEFDEDTHHPDKLSDLMGFGPVQHLTEEEKFDQVAYVPNIQQFWEELTDGTTVFRSSHSRSSEFRKKEHIFMQYLLGHSITDRFDATSSNHYYLRGVALYLGPYLTRILRATQQIVLTEPRAPGLQPLTAEAVARMRDKIVPKRARTADMAYVTDARREEEAYEAYPDAAGPAHAGVGGSSSSTDFQQQVLAQLAAMNMRFDHIDNRLDEIAAANAQSRAEAQAYYEWMRGHYPPPRGPPFPRYDPSSMG
nr:hypothetical protein Iba_chr10cCG9490 [Ipomoea batatas]